jgi:alkaline phosphatase D
MKLKVIISIIYLTIVLSCQQSSNEKAINKIAFGSCAFQWDEQSIWNTIANAEPDLFLFIGDAI